MGKVSVTINSRKYTVTAQESDEYILSLAEHINEKIETVLAGGVNVLGERPLILAALNICDEYFKVHEAGYTINEQLKASASKLAAQTEENMNLRKELDSLKKEMEPQQLSIDGSETNELEELRRELSDAKSQITFLEGQVKLMEDKVSEQKKEFAAREREILDLIDRQ